MPISFPHCSNLQITDLQFVAAWEEWFDRFGPGANQAGTGCMPRSARKETLQSQIAGQRQFSLDVLCRMLVPCRDTMQASQAFMLANPGVLDVCDATNSVSGRTVEGVKLTAASAALLSKVTASERDQARAVLEADIESVQEQAILDVPIDPASVSNVQLTQPPVPPLTTDERDLIGALVDWIEVAPHTACYRGKPGIQSVGWTNRLAGYFWPNPGRTHAYNQPILAAISAQAAALRGVAPWTPAQELDAVRFANAVFIWGGVPQGAVSWQQVRAVFDSVRSGHRVEDAPMNSGWTKVAAFASSGWAGVDEQVIWDSRVAHSLIRRMDAILYAAGQRGVPGYLVDIGRVPGRGGSRVEVAYQLKWPTGYGRWATQFAGSRLVGLVRDEVKRQGFNKPAGMTGPWTIRDVEMVLFMDGY